MANLSTIEKKRNIVLPDLYKEFYRQCIDIVPAKLIGTDLINDDEELTSHAADLLEEQGIANFLHNNDFVFMMHQGYMFWYFNADGNPDPVVYSYYEGKPISHKLGLLSDFIKEVSA